VALYPATSGQYRLRSGLSLALFAALLCRLDDRAACDNPGILFSVSGNAGLIHERHRATIIHP
jgi:hypothetical protein